MFSVILIVITVYILSNVSKPNQPMNGVYEYTLDPDVTLTIKNNRYHFKGEANFVEYFGHSGTFSQDANDEHLYSIDHLEAGPHLQFVDQNEIQMSYGVYYSVRYSFVRINE